MGDIYGDAGLERYELSGNTWLEVKDPVLVTQKGRRGMSSVGGLDNCLMALPGSNDTAIMCNVAFYICLRVNQNLDCQMKIVPESDESSGVWTGVATNSNRPGDPTSYRSVLVIYNSYFELYTERGETNILHMTNQGNILEHQTTGKDPLVLLHKSYFNDDSWISYYGNPFGNLETRSYYHWNIGMGNNAGEDGIGTKGSDDWRNSDGWFYVGNLQDDGYWSSSGEDFNGYFYFCGSGYYRGNVITNPTVCRARRVTIPGLKRLLDYFPWAVYKPASSSWWSCNRSGGHLQSKESSGWANRKNSNG